jgi:proline racemase
MVDDRTPLPQREAPASPMRLPAVATIDYHTAGEPFRIVPEPPVPIRGATVADRRVQAIESPEVDGLRRVLCFEPRGHADMYGGFITPPDDDGAHFGVLFWHKDGFSTACGHGTIALGAWAVESGRVPVDPSGVTDVVIDVPSGRVTARVHIAQDDRVTGVDFVNVPSALVEAGVSVMTGRGEPSRPGLGRSALRLCRRGIGRSEGDTGQPDRAHRARPGDQGRPGR